MVEKDTATLDRIHAQEGKRVGKIIISPTLISVFPTLALLFPHLI